MKLIKSGDPLPPAAFNLDEALDCVRRIHASGCVGIAMIGEGPETFKMEVVPRLVTTAWSLFRVGVSMTDPLQDVEDD